MTRSSCVCLATKPICSCGPPFCIIDKHGSSDNESAAPKVRPVCLPSILGAYSGQISKSKIGHPLAEQTEEYDGESNSMICPPSARGFSAHQSERFPSPAARQCSPPTRGTGSHLSATRRRGHWRRNVGSIPIVNQLVRAPTTWTQSRGPFVCQ